MYVRHITSLDAHGKLGLSEIGPARKRVFTDDPAPPGNSGGLSRPLPVPGQPDRFPCGESFVRARWIEAERDEALRGAGSADGSSSREVTHREEDALFFGGGPRKCPGMVSLEEFDCLENLPRP